MLNKFFMCQWNYPVKNDWTTQVRSDLEDFNLNVDLTDLKSKSKTTFKKIIKLKMKEYSLEYLNNLKEKHSKMENLTYSKLKLQNYLNKKIYQSSQLKTCSDGELELLISRITTKVATCH